MPPTSSRRSVNKSTQEEDKTSFVGKRKSTDSAAKEDDSTVVLAVVKEDNKIGTFLAGGNQDLLKHILSFVVRMDVKSSKCVKHLSWSRREGVKKDLKTCLAVSKSWNQVTWEIVCEKNPDKDIPISAQNLVQLKKGVCSLNLSPILPTFMKELRTRWGDERLEDVEETVLSVLVRFSEEETLESLAKEVEFEYRSFLLVKAVETLATKVKIFKEATKNAGSKRRKVCKPTPDSIMSAWTERCQPSKIVDLLWHAHMLHPRKYQEDCKALIGDIIDHEPGYMSKNEHKGSGYLTKKRALMDFEALLFPRLHFTHEHTLFHPRRDLYGVAQEYIAELTCDYDCGCG